MTGWPPGAERRGVRSLNWRPAGDLRPDGPEQPAGTQSHRIRHDRTAVLQSPNISGLSVSTTLPPISRFPPSPLEFLRPTYRDAAEVVEWRPDQWNRLSTADTLCTSRAGSRWFPSTGRAEKTRADVVVVYTHVSPRPFRSATVYLRKVTGRNPLILRYLNTKLGGIPGGTGYQYGYSQMRERGWRTLAGQ